MTLKSELLIQEKEKLGWQMLAEKSLVKVWSGETDEEWNHYLCENRDIEERFDIGFKTPILRSRFSYFGSPFVRRYENRRFSNL